MSIREGILVFSGRKLLLLFCVQGPKVWNVFGGMGLFSIRNNWSGPNANILVSTGRFMVDFVAKRISKDISTE